MGEGLYRPSEIDLPPKVEEALAGVVRIRPNIRFRVLLFESPEEAAAERSRPGARKKTFRPGGGVEWPVILDLATLRKLCDDPWAPLQPGFYEICEAFSEFEGRSCPATFLTRPLAGSATGFAVGRSPRGDLLVATCYHVAREAIERHRRTQGVYALEPVEAWDLQVLISLDGSHRQGSYREVRPVFLVANASSEDWKQGRDWALLSIPAEAPVRVLKMAERPPKAGETLWAAGFPFRTRRPPERLQALHYSDAADELRISSGEVVEKEGADVPHAASDLLVDLDGLSGNSGSPVLNREGEVVGLLRDSTYKEGELDLRIREYGGLAQVVPIEFVRALLQGA